MPDRRLRVVAGDPSPTAGRVQGLATLLAAYTPRPSRHLEGAGASLGLSPSRPSPRRDGYPSRGPCPPGIRCAVPSPDQGDGARLQATATGARTSRAFFPRRIRAVTRASRREPSMPSWGSPLQSVLPSARALAFVREHFPSRPCAGQRFVLRGPQGLEQRRSRVIRLRTTGSPGVLGLMTIVALRVPRGPEIGRAHV